MFWNQRHSKDAPSLDLLLGLHETEQREAATRLVEAGTWGSDDAEAALALARRLTAFVAPAPELEYANASLLADAIETQAA